MISHRDIFSLQVLARVEADRLRVAFPASDLNNPEISPEMRAVTRTRQEVANQFDDIGDILAWLEEEWPRAANSLSSFLYRQERQSDAAE